MTEFNVKATFRLQRSTDNKETVREHVKEAIIGDLQGRGYVVADGAVEVHVSEPRRPRRENLR